MEMGQNESRVQAKSKINRNQSNHNINIIGSNRRSPEISGSTVLNLTENTAHHDLLNNPRQIRLDKWEEFPNNSNSEFCRQEEIKSLCPIKGSKIVNQTEVPELGNHPLPLSGSQLSIHTKVPDVLATYPALEQTVEEPSFFSTVQSQAMADKHEPVIGTTWQTQVKTDHEQNVIFSRTQSEGEKDGNKPLALDKSLFKALEDDQQSVRISKTSPPDIFIENRPLEEKEKKSALIKSNQQDQPVPPSTSQLQDKRGETPLVPFCSSQIQNQKDGNHTQEAKNPNVKSPLSIQPQLKVEFNQPVLFTRSQSQEKINKNHDFGQPLTNMSNFSSQPQITKEISQSQVVFSTYRTLNTGSVTTNPLLEPLQEVVSTENPFLQSPAYGKIPKDISGVSVTNQSLGRPILRNRNDNYDMLSEIKETKNNSVESIDTNKGLKMALATNQGNLSVGVYENQSSSLKLPQFKDASNEESIKETLKHFEMIAENLASPAEKIKHQDWATKELRDLQNIEEHNKYKLHKCIEKMKNIGNGDKYLTASLQKELVTHLREIALFTSALKTYPIVNHDIYIICETIIENLSLLKSNYETKNTHKNIKFSSSPQGVLVSKTCESRNMTFYSQKNIQNHIAHVNANSANILDVSICSPITMTSEVEKECITEDSQNKMNPILENPAMTLLDQLPDDLTDDKQYISFRNSMLYCEICDKLIAFVLLNLIQHLRGKNHRALVAGLENTLSGSKSKLSHLSDLSDSLLPDEVTSELVNKCLPNASQPLGSAVKIKLSPNYEGVLDLIIESVKKGLNFNVEVFICSLCDFFENDKNKAVNHAVANHKNQLNADWHFCKTCTINIYGTEKQFKEHDMTGQHVDIAKLKNDNPLNGLSQETFSPGTTSGTEEFDRESMCSSKSNSSQSRLRAHEILLAIAKEKKDNNIEGPFGWFCQMCNKYSDLITLPDHLGTKKHITFTNNRNVRSKLSVRECSTCNVYLFGESNIWREHQNLEVHKELLALDSEKKLTKGSKLQVLDQDRLEETSNCDVTNVNSLDPIESNIQSESNSSESERGLENEVSDNLSLLNESGPHYDLMKMVLRKHFGKNPDDVFYGFYCHFCKLDFSHQEPWESHLNSSSHKAKINSVEYRGRQLEHDCTGCNVRLICDDQFFSLHVQSVAHKAIYRLLKRRQMVEESENEDDYWDDDEHECSSSENESVENEDEENDIKGNQNILVTNSHKRKDKQICVENGIYFTGVPTGSQYRDVRGYFNSCGPVKSLKFDKLRGSGTVVFTNKNDATTLLQKKKVLIRKTQVLIRPLLARQPGKEEKLGLDPVVVRALSSKASVAATVSSLLSEMSHSYNINQQKGYEINRDLSATVPGCNVIFFGSQVTGLATGKSDFDIYIDFDGKSFYTDLGYEQQQRIIKHLQYHLTQKGSKFLVRETILEARVPIIRVVHKKTNTLCDISCRSGLSVENSHLVRLYLHIDPRVRWLVAAVKFWMNANGLLDRNAFTSYATVWLVLFFLMSTQNPVICPVVTLQKNCKRHNVARWDCRFQRNLDDVYKNFRTSNKQSELELLASFFQMYTSCPFKEIVMCPLNGSYISRKQFKTGRLPREFDPYLEKIQDRSAEWLKLHTPICIQDPFDLSHNITKGVNRTDLWRFKSLCHQTYKMCRKLLTD